MNDNSSLERKERVMALSGLAATEPPAGTSCPVEETLAQFIEGQLTGRAREAMLAHLNRCPSCYYHWLEVGSYLNVAERTAPTATHTGSLTRIWERIQPWFSNWKIAVPIAATAVLVYAVGLWWSVSPDLNHQIDLAYARVSAQSTAPPSLRAALPMPWEGAAFAFSEPQPSPARQAFGAGLWAGRHVLLGTDKGAPPAFLSPPSGVDWPETAWADYYALGRWTVLVWTLTTGNPLQDWHPHLGILEGLLARLNQRVPGEEEALRAVSALQRLQPLLERKPDAPSRAELRRALEITMQQLAP